MPIQVATQKPVFISLEKDCAIERGVIEHYTHRATYQELGGSSRVSFPSVLPTWLLTLRLTYTTW